jgi:hypothetical protein
MICLPTKSVGFRKALPNLPIYSAALFFSLPQILKLKSQGHSGLGQKLTAV